jgi:hypothetical protein
VDSFGVPAIHGQRMLLVKPGQRTLLHLRRTGSEQTLVMDVRMFDDCLGSFDVSDGLFDLGVGVVGADTTTSAVLGLANPVTVSAGGSSIMVGDPQTVTVPLSGIGEDVVVFMLGYLDMIGSGCASVGALVDDVKLQ